MKQLFFTLIIFGILSSCSKTPSTVQKIIKQAGTNRNELLKVIDHYKELGNKQKLKAAYYLIANMSDKYGVYYPADAHFLNLLPQVDSLKKADASTDIIDAFIKTKFQQENEKFNYDPQYLKDIHVIKANYLINNIDLSFEVWKNKPWASHLNFDEFCEWILPYRVNNEPLQDWRSFMKEQLSWVEDSLTNINNLEEACLKVNSFIAKKFQFSHTLRFVPMLGGIDAWNNKQGLCEHRYQLITMAMRSIGIPVTIYFTPYYPHEAGNHSWTTLLNQEGGITTFNRGEEDAVMFSPGKSLLKNPSKIHVFFD